MRYTRLFKSLSVWLLVITLGLSAAAAYADGPDKDKDKDKQRQEAREAARKAAGPSCSTGAATTDLDVNNVRARLYNNGQLFYPDAVYEVPKGSGTQAIFASGIWIGGRVDGELRMAAATYAQGTDYEFFPGPLEETVATGDCSAYDRLWKVSRSDIEALDRGEAPTRDIEEWPWDLGAPVTDGDGNPDNYNLAAGDRPEVLGDQTVWWIMNDAAGPHLTTLAPPVNVEVQVTAFAFNTADALNNTTFYKYKIIYKGDAPLTDTFLGLWSDPDLGQFTDDFVGSDTTLGLGFVYNGDPNDEGGGGYGTSPPALGYDFFQGPLVNTDEIDNDGDGDIDEDDERLQMTRFVYYNNDNTDQGNPGDAEDYYGYLRGRWRDGSRMTIGGDGFGDDLGLGPTNFMFTGEPPGFWSEDNTDGAGTRNTPADRRFLMSTGPWTMQPGEEQEIVFGIIWSQTANRIGSVKKLKADDILAQGAFDFDFDLPPAPDAPTLQATELDGTIVLSWDYPPSANNYLNQYDEPSPFLVDQNAADTTYTFEGYKVYQYVSPADYPNNGVLIATVDVVNEVTTVTDEAIDPTTGAPIVEISAQGTDSGAQNFLILEEDAITDQPLRNYTDYYYGVQAYAYNAFSNPKVYQSPIVGDPGGEGPLRVVPSKVVAREGGTVTNTDPSVLLSGTRTAGVGGGLFEASVVDPLEITGQDYTLDIVEVQTSEETTALSYVLRRGGDVLIDGQAYFDQYGKLPPQGDNVVVEDGLSFTLRSPDPELLGWTEVQSEAGIDPCGPEAASTAGCATLGNNINGSFNATGNILGHLPFESTTSEFLGPFAPNDYEIRFTEEGSIAITAFSGNERKMLRVPFEVWDVGVVPPGQENDPSDDVQIHTILFVDSEGGECEYAYGDGEPFAGRPAADEIYGFYPVAGTTYDDFEAQFAAQVEGGGGCIDRPDGVFDFINTSQWPLYSIEYTDNSDGATGAHPPIGHVSRIYTTDPFVIGDQYVITTGDITPVVQDPVTAEEALDLMGVVPNPYRGASSYDPGTFQNQVRFTNLPERATIRIFSLNGTLVRQLEKSSPDPMFTWDLRSEDGLPLSSGIYLVHIEVPDVGERVIKFGVVQKRVQLNVF